jgi:Methyltransferase domain
MVHWFERLHGMGVFEGKSTILELGPQDLVVTSPVIFNFLQSVSPSPNVEGRLAADFFDQGQPRPLGMRAFYGALGLDRYWSLDLDDPRADYRMNLNDPISLARRFDVITNFGTLEHVFNVGTAMKCIHDHLEVGGLALHVLPTRGDYNHGFYNLHSTWYRDVARANGYEIADLVYMPDFLGQHLGIGRDEKRGEAPPRRSTMIDIRNADPEEREESFARTVALRLFRRRWLNKQIDPRVFDYIFAALRKCSDAPFALPMQSIYATPRGEN